MRQIHEADSLASNRRLFPLVATTPRSALIVQLCMAAEIATAELNLQRCGKDNTHFCMSVPLSECAPSA